MAGQLRKQLGQRIRQLRKAHGLDESAAVGVGGLAPPPSPPTGRAASETSRAGSISPTKPRSIGDRWARILKAVLLALARHRGAAG